MNKQEIELRALHMRENVLKMAFNCGGSAHLGGGLSLVDILAVLYGDIMNTSDRSLPFAVQDKFILSKGHGVLGLYTALAEFGIIDEAVLNTFQQNGSDLIAHPVMNEKLGLESSSGSLGQGISMAVGLALSAKKRNYIYQTYVVCGNGECNEGSVWEAAMSAVNFKLDNLTIVIDNNHLQSDGISSKIMDVSSKYLAMFEALGFQTFEVDGHNITQMQDAFHAKHVEDKPKAIVANTIKGKGIAFMENNNEWHHNRLTKVQYEEALKELRDSK